MWGREKYWFQGEGSIWGRLNTSFTSKCGRGMVVMVEVSHQQHYLLLMQTFPLWTVKTS